MELVGFTTEGYEISSGKMAHFSRTQLVEKRVLGFLA
jgi:hypothetical protein